MRDFIYVASAVVYMATNNLNGKRYIGATDRGIAHRASRHKWDAKHGKKRSKFHSAIRKYGFSAFEFRLLLPCVDFFDALENEARLIKELKPEYNLTSGGGGVKGLRFSAESKARMSAAKAGRPPAWLNGENDAEIRKKISEGLRRRKGKPQTEKQRAHTLRMRKLGNAGRRKAVICLTDGVRYGSLTEAAKKYNLTTGQVAYYCKGNHESRRGLDFRYEDEEEDGF